MPKIYKHPARARLLLALLKDIQEKFGIDVYQALAAKATGKPPVFVHPTERQDAKITLFEVIFEKEGADNAFPNRNLQMKRSVRALLKNTRRELNRQARKK